MQINPFSFYFFFSFFHLIYSPFTSLFLHANHDASNNQAIHPLASLVFYLGEQEKYVASGTHPNDEIVFSNQSVAQLFYGNPYVPKRAQWAMRPYLLPCEHSKRYVLDSIFFMN